MSGVPGAAPTIVLVHGAFATAASWSAVTASLEAAGRAVVAPELALRSIPEDTATVVAALDAVDGPALLVGHSYGGIVISNAAVGRDDVTGLVFIAAFAPAEGESILSLAEQIPGSRVGPDTLAFTPFDKDDGSEGTEASILPEAFHEVFAADLPEEVAAGAAATQRAASLDALGGSSGPVAWESLPTWSLVATADQVIPLAAGRLMAERAASETVEIDASHLVLVSQPDAVVELITSAASR